MSSPAACDDAAPSNPQVHLNMSAQPLPREITSHDLLKTLAVIVMVVDHLGYYFFPGEMMWRAVGRTGFPIWFFLVGHATGRDLPGRLIASALILLAVNPVIGLAFLPLNALVTIMLIRVLLDPLMRFAMHSRARLGLSGVVLAAIVIPTCYLTEYGTLGIITAMFGYCVRHREEGGRDALAPGFMVFALLTFVFYQQLFFAFMLPEFIVMAAGTALTHFVLLHFRPRLYTETGARIPAAVAAAIRFCGRRTLEIYVVHLLIFGFLAAWLGMPNFVWFEWRSGLPFLAR